MKKMKLFFKKYLLAILLTLGIVLCKTNLAYTQPIVFKISPLITTLPNCSTTPVLFQCINVNNSPGFWYYNWTVGNGWTTSGNFTTTTNSIYLTPSSPINIPSSVSVRPVSGSFTYSLLSSSVTRSSFTSTAIISGTSTTLCTGSSGVFNLSGLTTGQTVTWSLSNSSIATLSNATNTQTTVNMNGAGTVNLQATITNACNQTVFKTLALYSGIPSFTSFSCDVLGNDFCSGTVEVETNGLPTLNINDRITASFKGLTTSEAALASNWTWQKFNNTINITPSKNTVSISMLNYGATGVRVRARNACGWSDWNELPFSIIELPTILEKNSLTYNYSIFPNPAKNQIQIYTKYPSKVRETYTSVQAELLNLMGIPKRIVSIGKSSTKMDLNGLEKGIYVLKINMNGKIERHTIIID
jgi:hypothetical protein